MTEQETDVVVADQVKGHFAPKKPEPKLEIAPEVKDHFVRMYDQQPAHVANRPSDYDCTIIKEFDKSQQKKSTSAKRGKKIP